MIRIDDLVFRYPQGDFELGVPALRVARGERDGVVGPTGSGTTTLLHQIAGIALPDRGAVHTGGTEVSALSESERRDFRIRNIGLVFQEFELIDYLSVLDNVLLPFRINPLLRLDASVRDRAARLIAGVGLADRAARLVTRLSHGEKQRVAVCRALIAEPDLILADEPTGNLDPGNKGRVLDILLGYAKEHAATLLTVTHDHDLLPRFDRLIDFKTFVSSPGATS